jgi:hypothetical protein
MKPRVKKSCEGCLALTMDRACDLGYKMTTTGNYPRFRSRPLEPCPKPVTNPEYLAALRNAAYVRQNRKKA